ncbi:hypothetical protein F5Y03DRAFT_5028 [Xylaria venustula]|nr:hypothetical protein F5Y03DRAFT_5028 [Xylaria venustula]
MECLGFNIKTSSAVESSKLAGGLGAAVTPRDNTQKAFIHIQNRCRPNQQELIVKFIFLLFILYNNLIPFHLQHIYIPTPRPAPRIVTLWLYQFVPVFTVQVMHTYSGSNQTENL